MRPNPSSTKLDLVVNSGPDGDRQEARGTAEGPAEGVLWVPRGYPSANRPQGSFDHLFCDLKFPVILLLKIWRDHL